MYIRDLIPQNTTELAEAVPIANSEEEQNILAYQIRVSVDFTHLR